MSTIRIPRKKQENKEKLSVTQDHETGAQPQDIRAERVEEAEFENAKEREELPEHYRTRIDKY